LIPASVAGAKKELAKNLVSATPCLESCPEKGEVPLQVKSTG